MHSDRPAIILVGMGSFAREVVGSFFQDSQTDPPFALLGYAAPDLCEDPSIQQTVQWLGTDQAVHESFAGSLFSVAISDPHSRLRLVQEYVSAGLRPGTLTHDASYVARSSMISAGCVIARDVRLMNSVSLGEWTHVDRGSDIGHDCKLGAFVTVHPRATLSGGVKVGDLSTIGTGAVVLPGVALGQGAVVGAGSVVTRDVPEYMTVVGNPARPFDGHRT